MMLVTTRREGGRGGVEGVRSACCRGWEGRARERAAAGGSGGAPSVLVLIARANPKSHSLTRPLELRMVEWRGWQGGWMGADRARQALARVHAPDEDVLWLHVAMDDAPRVQVVQRCHQLHG